MKNKYIYYFIAFICASNVRASSSSSSNSASAGASANAAVAAEIGQAKAKRDALIDKHNALTIETGKNLKMLATDHAKLIAKLQFEHSAKVGEIRMSYNQKSATIALELRNLELQIQKDEAAQSTAKPGKQEMQRL